MSRWDLNTKRLRELAERGTRLRLTRLRRELEAKLVRLKDEVRQQRLYSGEWEVVRDQRRACEEELRSVKVRLGRLSRGGK